MQSDTQENCVTMYRCFVCPALFCHYFLLPTSFKKRLDVPNYFVAMFCTYFFRITLLICIFETAFAKQIKGQNEQAGAQWHYKHLGGTSSGKIAQEEEIEQEFLSYFSKDAKANVPWEEPKMLKNCWAQTMLASKYGFSPSCNEDGSFAAKQCYLERCWCVNRDGQSQITAKDKRFYYSVAGIMLVCNQNY